jgi:sugar lactone lactonase YvrE
MGNETSNSLAVEANFCSISQTATALIKDQVTPMLFRKHIVSTRTHLQLAVAIVFSVAAVGAAFAANSGIAPLLVPYTVQTIAGTPQFAGTTTSVASGYFGEGVPATTSLAHQTGAAVMNGPYAITVDSVGNVYIADTGNYIIREVNAQTGLINTVAGVTPKGCTGTACSLKTFGCADGTPAVGNPIGSKIEGITVDAYGNVFFSDATTMTASVVYRGGTQIANFIALVDPGGVAVSGGVKIGYVYHIAGGVNLSTCAAVKGNADNGLAFTNTASGAAPTADLAAATQTYLITVDSADNIYLADTGNLTTRVINTQATPQTFFQYTVQPGFMRSISNCNAALTVPCPTAPTTTIANTGVNGPVNAIVYNSQNKTAQVDAYGNLYQLQGTGGSTGPPGIYGATAYAGGAPLTNLIQAESPYLAGTYGPNSATPGNAPAALNSAGLPTYGASYMTLNNPNIPTKLPSFYASVIVPLDGAFDVRSSSFLPDNFGSFWFMDNHYPELNRVDQYTALATLFLASRRATGNITPLNNSPASFLNPYYCVYGSTSSKIAWTQGPQTFDPQGDGCPAMVAFFTGGNYQTASDGLANIYVGDPNEQLERELVNGNIFPTAAVGTAAPVTQAIQVHFHSSNPPKLGGSVPDAGASGVTTTSFSIAPGITDFTVNTTTPEFPFGSLLGAGGYANTTTTPNFQMWAGLPTCTQLGAYPNATGVTDYDCLVYVTFNPTAPGVRQSQLVVTTVNGSVYNFALFGVATGGQLAIDGGSATPVAIAGLGGASGNGPSAVAVNSAGTLYVADPANNRIVIEPAGGTQTNLTFTGVNPATLSGPMGVALDGANNIYISDTGNNRILKVNPITSVAAVLGNYVWVPGSTCYFTTSPAPDCPTTTPSSVTATTAPPQYAFNHPQGLAVDVWNNVYVADTGNKVVVEIPSNLGLGGAVPLLAYPGAPSFSKPVAVAVDSLGNIYVADNQVSGAVVVKLPPGGGDLANLTGTTFTNTKAANLLSPNGIAVDGAGNVYVSDNSLNQVYEIPSASGAAGTPFALNFPTVNSPTGLALDPSGNLYVADTGNNQILFSNRQTPLVNFGTVTQNLTYGSLAGSGVAGYVGTPPTPAPCPIDGNGTICTGVLTVTNIGSSPINLTNPLVPAATTNPAYTLSTLNCVTPLPPGSTCTIIPIFKPTATTNGPQTATVSVNGGTQSISLVANGAQPLAKIVLSAAYSTGTTPTAGATATITATVTQPFIAGNTPTGTVTFTYTIDASNNNLNNCGTGGTVTVPLVGGVASFPLPVLVTGVQYTVNAKYSGDTFNSDANATKLDVFVPGITVTSTVTSTAAQLTYVYGTTPPTIAGTVTPTPASPVTFTFGSAATSCSSVAGSPYPVVVTFHGTGACAYGFPSSSFAAGGNAVMTEKVANLTYALPNFTAQYGAPDITYGASATLTGAVCSDSFSANFAPPKSSILNVGPFTVTPTVVGHSVGNYAVTAATGALTITQAPVAIGISAAKTSVPNTTAGLASATFGISITTAVPQGIGTPSGSVTISDVFTPITATGYGTALAPTTSTLPLVAGFATYIPTSTTPGLHQYSFSYSGDSNFQKGSLAPSSTAVPCTASVPSTNCLVVDNPDFTLTSTTGPVVIIPGVIPSGNGLPIAPNQSTAAPETAVLFVSAVQGFVGSVSLACTTQNSYVTCFMTPTTVCFATVSSSACTNTSATAATVVAVETPATLPLGFTGQTRVSPTKTVLAFLPFGILAFCVRRRRRLSKALWMLIAVAAISVGMSGCGGNTVAFYTPVPTGPQTVTVTATYLGNGPGGTQPAATRSFVVPIAID